MTNVKEQSQTKINRKLSSFDKVFCNKMAVKGGRKKKNTRLLPLEANNIRFGLSLPRHRRIRKNSKLFGQSIKIYLPPKKPVCRQKNRGKSNCGGTLQCFRNIFVSPGNKGDNLMLQCEIKTSRFLLQVRGLEGFLRRRVGLQFIIQCCKNTATAGNNST